jgi:hypothetical protein
MFLCLPDTQYVHGELNYKKKGING